MLFDIFIDMLLIFGITLLMALIIVVFKTIFIPSKTREERMYEMFLESMKDEDIIKNLTKIDKNK